MASDESRQSFVLSEARRMRLLALDQALKLLFLRVHIELRYGNEWELLVAVILSRVQSQKR